MLSVDLYCGGCATRFRPSEIDDWAMSDRCVSHASPYDRRRLAANAYLVLADGGTGYHAGSGVQAAMRE